MLCEDCLKKSISKLDQNDIIVLEYLKQQGAVSTHFSFSKQTIQKEANFSVHHITGTLQRLELLELINIVVRGSKSSKYYITSNGIKALKIVEEVTI